MKKLYEVNFNGNSKLIERVFAKDEAEAKRKIYKIYDKKVDLITKIYEP